MALAEGSSVLLTGALRIVLRAQSSATDLQPSRFTGALLPLMKKMARKRCWRGSAWALSSPGCNCRGCRGAEEALVPTWTWRCSRSHCLSSATHCGTRLIPKGIRARVNMMETQTACIREMYLIFTKLTITLSSLKRIVWFCFSVSQEKTPNPLFPLKALSL